MKQAKKKNPQRFIKTIGQLYHAAECPAEVLKALGGNPQSIKKQQHSGIKFNPATPEPSISGLPVAKVPKLPALFISTAKLTLLLTLTAKKRPINRYSLKINEKTTTITLGKAIPAGKSNNINCELLLRNGLNWIEIKAIDDKGATGNAIRFRLIGRDLPE